MIHRRLGLPAAVLTLGAAVALAPARPDPPPTAARGDLLVASVNVAKLWDHKAFLPVREARGSLEFAWMVQSLFGLAPGELERLALAQPTADGPLVVAVTGRKPIDPAAVAKTLTRTPGATAPKPPVSGAAVAPGAEFPFVIPVNARTVMLAPAGVNSTDLTRLTKVLAEESKTAVSLRLDMTAAKALLGDQMPASLAVAQSATFTADLPDEKTAKVALALTFADAAAAKAAVPAVEGLLRDVAKWAGQREAASAVGPAGEFPRPVFEVVGKAVKAAKVTADGPRVVAAADLDAADAVSRVLAAVPDAVLNPQVGSAGENNLKQIGLALHSYHDANGKLPANIYDKDGKALLSWRVQILPYIEQDALYQAFKRDEPWDSAHNLPLSKVLIKTYAVPGRPAEPGHTYFRAFIGPKNVKPEYRPWLLEGDTKGLALVGIPDGTSNTILVAEAGESVPWSKPEDLPYDGVAAIPTLGGPSGRFLTLFGDGSVRAMRRDRVDEKNLRAMITVQGGEVIVIP